MAGAENRGTTEESAACGRATGSGRACSGWEGELAGPSGAGRRSWWAQRSSAQQVTLVGAVIGAGGAMMAAMISVLIPVLTSPRTTDANGSQPGQSAHLLITRVSFGTDNGKNILIVSGIYHERRGDGYLYAVARPSKVPFGSSKWLVSEPVTPSRNGEWTATIVLPAGRQRMTVFAVITQAYVGCPPGAECSPLPRPPEWRVRARIAANGPHSARYSTHALSADPP